MGQNESSSWNTDVEMKSNGGFWRVLDKPDQSNPSEDCQFLCMLSSIERWRGSMIPDMVGTLKIQVCCGSAAYE